MTDWSSRSEALGKLSDSVFGQFWQGHATASDIDTRFAGFLCANRARVFALYGKPTHILASPRLAEKIDHALQDIMDSSASVFSPVPAPRSDAERIKTQLLAMVDGLTQIIAFGRKLREGALIIERMVRTTPTSASIERLRTLRVDLAICKCPRKFRRHWDEFLTFTSLAETRYEARRAFSEKNR